MLYRTNNTAKAMHHSDVMKGRTLSEETRNKISESNKGKKRSDINKKHMSDAHKRKSPGNKGKHLVWNEEHTKFHYE